MSNGIIGLEKVDPNNVWTPKPETDNPPTYASNRFLEINGVTAEKQASGDGTTTGSAGADQPGLGEGDTYDYDSPGVPLWGADDKGVPEMDDAVQGGLADCYAIASMAATAKASPETIQENIVDNEDGTYTVTFYEKTGLFGLGGYKPVEVTVDDEVPVNDSGDPVYAGASADGESWVMIYEKAYAEFSGGSYESIEWDFAETAMEAMNGQDFNRRNPDDMSDAELIGNLENGMATVDTVGQGEDDKTIDTFGDENIVARHTYVVKDVSEKDGETFVELYNPWGYNHPTLTLDEVREVSDRITVAD